MRKVIVIAVLFSLLNSCSSTKADKSFICETIPENFSVSPKIISVTVNQIADEEISSQIKKIFSLKLREIKDSVPLEETEKNFLHVTISSRSFIKNYEPVHSIFTQAQITDLEGKLIYENCFYTISKEDISSVIVQKQIADRVTKNIRQSGKRK